MSKKAATQFEKLYGCAPPTPDAPMASRRDASWYRSPNCYGKAPKLHVTIDGHTAACNPHQPVISGELQTLESVDALHRCKRKGCRERWTRIPEGE